jgi:hypothetical protein
VTLLLPQHLADLKNSGLLDETISACRFYSVTDAGEAGRILRWKSPPKALGPFLAIPFFDLDGKPNCFTRLKPDRPRTSKKDGKPVKYESPCGTGNRTYFPPGVGPALGDPTVPLLLTEGEKKAAAAVQHGFACVGLVGVNGFHKKRPKGEYGKPKGPRVFIDDLAAVAWGGRTVFVCYDSDLAQKPQVRRAEWDLAELLREHGATVKVVRLPAGPKGEKQGLDDYLIASGADAFRKLMKAAKAPRKPKRPPSPPNPASSEGRATRATNATGPPGADGWRGDLGELLGRVHEFLGRFISYPDEHGRLAHTLWVAHAHAMDAWESTPRLAFLSPEPASGKTRALEITELLVPRPVESVNATPAYLFRKVSDPAGLPTILFDEIDTLFGPRAKENEDVRGMLNAGHRRGARAGRCVVRGEAVETEELPAYCAVALAGLGDLPDTLMSRAVVIRMRRRSPGDRVEPFRRRVHQREGHPIRDELSAWATRATNGGLADHRPEMPDGITDRAADVWESLLTVADAAGGDWPGRARAAAVALVALLREDGGGSLGVRLLTDLKAVWDGTEGMHTERILELLNALDEAPWGDLKGKPLDSRRLARMLAKYGVKPADVRAVVAGVEKNRKGYRRADLHDPWRRYVAGAPEKDATPPPDSEWGEV